MFQRLLSGQYMRITNEPCPFEKIATRDQKLILQETLFESRSPKFDRFLMISEIFKRSYFGLGEKDVYSYFAIFFVIFIYDPIAALYFSIFCKLF